VLSPPTLWPVFLAVNAVELLSNLKQGHTGHYNGTQRPAQAQEHWSDSVTVCHIPAAAAVPEIGVVDQQQP
jgi:hypothetical protein